MPTDYVLFNHGVSTRSTRPEPTYADALFELIQSQYHPTSVRTLKKVVLYWGDVNNEEEQRLLATYRASAIWEKMWFKSIRETHIMQFVGDGALYLSRYVGAKIARVLAEQTDAGLRGYDPKEDRLHLITHSMGTIILFDMLFSARWDSTHVPGYSSVNAIRNLFFGIGSNPDTGIALGSISTLGSPIGFFSLMDVDQSTENTTDSNGNVLSTHDITPRLERMLISLHNELGRKLPWYNFVHPGDPVAYPLEKLLPQLVDRNNQCIDIQDILVAPIRLTDKLAEPMRQSIVALLDGVAAHSEYMDSPGVAEKIAQAIVCASCIPTIDDTPAVVAKEETLTVAAEEETLTVVANSDTPAVAAEEETPAVVADGDTPAVVANGEMLIIAANGDTPTIAANGERLTIAANGDTPTVVVDDDTPTIAAP